MLTVGLTGGIGSGKSTAAACFRELGCPTLDMDLVAREITRPGEPALRAIVEEFGPAMLRPDGSLDRARLAATIFEDNLARARLEGILHPAIRERADAWAALEAARTPAPPAALEEVPLLFEAGLEDHFDRIVLICARPEVRLQRLIEGRKMSEEDARARMQRQLPDSVKRQRSHYVIENSDGLGELRRGVQWVWNALLEEAQAGG